MSHFICEHCGAHIVDSPKGYLSGCRHYPKKPSLPKHVGSWMEVWGAYVKMEWMTLAWFHDEAWLSYSKYPRRLVTGWE